MQTSRITQVVLSAALAASALPAGAQSSRTTASDEVTFTADIAPILFDNCASCHRPGENAPFSLTSYTELRPRGRQIVQATRSHQMPPWKAAPGDYAFKGDRRLTDAQISLLQRWVDSGMREGDPLKLPRAEVHGRLATG